MACPNCGSLSGSVGGRCSVCGFAIAADAATTTLTPPPPTTTGITANGSTSTSAGIGATGATDETMPAAAAGDSSAQTRAQTMPLVMGPLGIGQNFGTRYHVIRLLGIGGMGAVYQAWDQVLEVAVAIKVIRVDPSADPETAAELEKRFKRELLLARQVTHKNVVRIHDLGEIDGIKYITMPYIQGADLSTVLKRDGRLPVPRALAIAKQVVSGLVAAHEAGVVHRDLKPANIMLDAEDHACVMDFGIARSTSGGTGVAMTSAGAVVGTVEYMAPEQAKGQAVDQRADVYALGLILRDMLLGPRQHGAGTAMSDLMSRMAQAPPSLRSLDPQLPQAVDDIVTRCLQPDPAARYDTTRALLDDLEELTEDGHPILVRPPAAPVVVKSRRGPALAIAAVLVAALAGGAVWIWKSATPPPAAVAAPTRAVSIAVLPFGNQGGDVQLASIGASVAEVLRSELGQSTYLRTVPAERLDQVLRDLRIEGDTVPDPATIKRIAELTSADVVLVGDVSRLGREIRLAGSLYEVARDAAPKRINAQATDEAQLLAAVEGLARDARSAIVAAENVAKITPSHGPLSRSLDAVNGYSEGLRLARQGNHEEAVKGFKTATEADPSFALAFARLALSYSSAGNDAEAQQASTRAVELSETAQPADKFFILANDASIKGDSAKAIEYYKQLVDAAPTDVATRFELATLLERSGEYAAAREQLARILEQDPKFANALLAAGRVEIRRGAYQESLRPLNEALTLSVTLGNDRVRASALQAIGISYKRLGKPTDALHHFTQALEIRRRLGDKRGVAGSLNEITATQVLLGKPVEAMAAFREAEPLWRQIGDRTGLATAYSHLGNLHREQGRYDDALEAFKRSLQIYREINDTGQQGSELNNIGSAYFEKGQYEDALTYFERALTIREKLGNPVDLSETVHNVGETHLHMGQLGPALDQYLRALDLARKTTVGRSIAIEAYSVGTVFEYQGRYGAAVKSRAEAYEQFRKLDDRSFWNAEVQSGYGRSLMLAGQLDDAKKILDQALKVARDQGNQAVVVRTLNDLGDYHWLAGDAAAGRVSLDEAQQIAAKLGDQELVIRTQVNQALRSTRDKARASQAAATLSRLAEQADTRGLKHLALEAAIGRAEALLAAGQHEQAVAEAQRALTRADNLGMRMLQARAHHVAARAAAAGGNAAVARRHFADAKRILDEMAAESRPGDLKRRADVKEMLDDAAKATN